MHEMNCKDTKYSNLKNESMKILDKNIGELLYNHGVILWKTNLMSVRRNL